MKIDVEGHELEVLRGAAGTIARCKPILLIEIERRHQSRPIEDVFREIEQMGYQGAFVVRAEGESSKASRSNRLGEAFRLIPISTFSPAVHQKADPMSRDYINNFVFRPA